MFCFPLQCQCTGTTLCIAPLPRSSPSPQSPPGAPSEWPTIASCRENVLNRTVPVLSIEDKDWYAWLFQCCSVRCIVKRTGRQCSWGAVEIDAIPDSLLDVGR